MNAPISKLHLWAILSLFLIKGFLSVAIAGMASRVFTELRYAFCTRLLELMDEVDFRKAQEFRREKLGFMGRQIPEALFNVINGVLQIAFSFVFLAAVLVMSASMYGEVVGYGLALVALLFSTSLGLSYFLKRRAKAALLAEEKFEMQWSEQLQVWEERRILGILSRSPWPLQMRIQHRRTLAARDYWRSAQAPVLEFFFVAGLLGFIFYSRGEASSVAVAAVILVLQRVQSRIQACMLALQQVRDELPVLEELSAFFDTTQPSEISRSPSALNENSVLVKNLNFGYPGRSNLITDFHLQVRQGEWLRIYGPNGSGKTTLAHLLLGLLKPDCGQIYIYGQKPQFRRCSGVSSAVTVVDGDLWTNLKMGRALSPEQMESQLKQIGLWPYLNLWCPDVLGARSMAEMGLSAGERQILGLARALVEELDLLILDEATSHLTTLVEEQVLSALKCARPQLTVVVISHRDSVLSFVDQSCAVERRPSSGLVTLDSPAI